MEHVDRKFLQLLRTSWVPKYQILFNNKMFKSNFKMTFYCMLQQLNVFCVHLKGYRVF